MVLSIHALAAVVLIAAPPKPEDMAQLEKIADYPRAQYSSTCSRTITFNIVW